MSCVAASLNAACSFPGLCHTLPSWSTLLSAGIERPQDFWSRNESVVAEDSAQVQRWFHLRQVMLAQSYPAHRSSKVFLFFSIPTCSTGLMFRFQGRWAGLLGFNSLPHQVALWRSCVNPWSPLTGPSVHICKLCCHLIWRPLLLRAL